MRVTGGEGVGRFRVWITAYEHGQPSDFRGVPPGAIALEPAEEELMSDGQAAAYVEAFNRAASSRSRKIWAVALPVTVRYDGEPRPGESIGPAPRQCVASQGF